MFTDAQILYIEEVLGTTVESFQTAVPVAAANEVAVLTPPLEPEELTLLAKVLASIKLTAYTHVQSLDQVPAGAVHVLSFQEANGRWTEGGRIWWGLPSLSLMVGNGPAVASSKKEAWALLQQFQRELE